MSGAGPEAVQVLVTEGEMVNITDEVGRTAAEAAILYCSSSVLEVILMSLKKIDRGKFVKVRFDYSPASHHDSFRMTWLPLPRIIQRSM